MHLGTSPWDAPRWLTRSLIFLKMSPQHQKMLPLLINGQSSTLVIKRPYPWWFLEKKSFPSKIFLVFLSESYVIGQICSLTGSRGFALWVLQLIRDTWKTFKFPVAYINFIGNRMYMIPQAQQIQVTKFMRNCHRTPWKMKPSVYISCFNWAMTTTEPSLINEVN